LNGSKATLQALINVKLELVHPLKIEHNASATAVNLKTIVVLSPGGESRSFNGAHRLIPKLHERQGSVINLDWRHGAAFRQGTFGDKGFQ
jgi:hypothetical protein